MMYVTQRKRKRVKVKGNRRRFDSETGPNITPTQRPLFSVVIPYYDRLPYIERTLQALAQQDVSQEQFEVVIGCLEFSEALVRTLAKVASSMRVRCVMTREPWKVARARNLAFAHSQGEVLVILDSDILLPRGTLRQLRDNHDLLREDCVLIGQMLNYSAYTEVLTASLENFEYYRDTYLASQCRNGLGVDARWIWDRKIPWSLCWTAFMCVPRRLLERHSLYFDESFAGWGAEDLEWGYRIQRAGIPIRFADDLWGMHLPHRRSVRQNCAQQELNYERFLCKWPSFEVEIVTRFGDEFANRHFDELCSEWAAVRGGGEAVNVVEFGVGARRQLALGAVSDTTGKLINCGKVADISQENIVKQMPLLGFRLPYPGRSVEKCYLLPSLRNASESARALILSETSRIASVTSWV
jgi:GT2 family glycosyltransferase